MKTYTYRLLIAMLILATSQSRIFSSEPAEGAGTGASQELTFEKHIRPILRAHCLDCHGADENPNGKLDLRQVRLILKGGESGPAIVPGHADDSYLIQRIQNGEMPPGEVKVTAAEQETLNRWIAQGAKTARPEPENIPPGLGLSEEDRQFWSFRPVVRPEAPKVPDAVADRVRSPIDSFLLSAMPEGLSFAAEADRPTLIRRLYFDLIGLPPSVEEQQRWQNEASENWYSLLIDELLSSEHYGERWARHWLDVAGYADSDGYTVNDTERAWTWKYRDYVIRALNQDKPFDRFIAEQLAGDELAGSLQGDLTPEQIQLLTATGFLRLAADGTGSGSNDDEGRNQVVADTLRIVSTSLLGVSLACAQCHDHRYDPILQTDYYAMRAVFAPALDTQQWKTPGERMISLYTAADRQKAAEVNAEAEVVAAERAKKEADYMAQALEKELTKYDAALRDPLRTAYRTAADQRTPEQKALLEKYPSVNLSPGVLYQYLPDAAEDLKKYDAKIGEIRGRRPPEEFLSILTEPANHAPETRLFHRGDYRQPKQAVVPAALTVTWPENSPVVFASDDTALPTTGRRTAFAQWVTSSQNPLAARVLVNRIWLHHFGRGIVTTPADFGQLGARPSHPELLDWLATEFIQQKWSLKQLHRVILMSSAWRQSTVRTAMHDALDPDNRYFSRRSIVRLDAEVFRDRLLSASGKLSPTMYGAPVPIREDDAGQIIVDPDQTRRSLYIKVRRSQPVAMLQAFDAPVMETNCELRPVSTVATQSLMLMNSESILQFAKETADRCVREPVTLTAEQREGLASMPPAAVSPWQYGYGAFDTATGKVSQFTPLAHWTGSSWQAGPALPDPVLGYPLLSANGGHPDAPERSVIRRWVAPRDGVVAITGSLDHSTGNGDGVRGRIVSSRSGLAGEWTAYNGSSPTSASGIAVQAGDTIDLVADCRETITSDSFAWTATLTLQPADGAALTFSSSDGFHGPVQDPQLVSEKIARAFQLAYGRNAEHEELVLATQFAASQIAAINAHSVQLPAGRDAMHQALTDVCHALLTSNEFLYVD